jgi:hypothetical protein
MAVTTRLRPFSSQAAGMSRYSVAEEITSICADFVVVEVVPPNRSPTTKFPANREKNREILNFPAARSKITPNLLVIP